MVISGKLVGLSGKLVEITVGPLMQLDHTTGSIDRVLGSLVVLKCTRDGPSQPKLTGKLTGEEC